MPLNTFPFLVRFLINMIVGVYVIRWSRFCGARLLAFSSLPFARLKVLGFEIISVLPLIGRSIDFIERNLENTEKHKEDN